MTHCGQTASHPHVLQLLALNGLKAVCRRNRLRVRREDEETEVLAMTISTVGLIDPASQDFLAKGLQVVIAVVHELLRGIPEINMDRRALIAMIVREPDRPLRMLVILVRSLAPRTAVSRWVRSKCLALSSSAKTLVPPQSVSLWVLSRCQALSTHVMSLAIYQSANRWDHSRCLHRTTRVITAIVAWVHLRLSHRILKD